MAHVEFEFVKQRNSLITVWQEGMKWNGFENVGNLETYMLHLLHLYL